MFSGLTSEGMDSTRDQLTAMVTGWSVDEVRAIARETMHHVVTPSIYAEAANSSAPTAPLATTWSSSLPPRPCW